MASFLGESPCQVLAPTVSFVAEEKTNKKQKKMDP